jgi:transcriptional regulator with GAF, ATPase, and Fis domain
MKRAALQAQFAKVLKGKFRAKPAAARCSSRSMEMPSALQVKLLRVLDSGGFLLLRIGSTDPPKSDVRIIAASNRDPSEAMAASATATGFVSPPECFPLRLAPLRERYE